MPDHDRPRNRPGRTPPPAPAGAVKTQFMIIPRYHPTLGAMVELHIGELHFSLQADEATVIADTLTRVIHIAEDEAAVREYARDQANQPGMAEYLKAEDPDGTWGDDTIVFLTAARQFYLERQARLRGRS